jgi:uncharacterized protein YutD
VALLADDKVDAVLDDEVKDGLEDKDDAFFSDDVENALEDKAEDDLEDRIKDSCKGVASFIVEVVREVSVVNVVPFVS